MEEEQVLLEAFFVNNAKRGDGTDNAMPGIPVPSNFRLHEAFGGSELHAKGMDLRQTFHTVMANLRRFTTDREVSAILTELAFRGDEDVINPFRDPVIEISQTLSIQEFFTILGVFHVHPNWTQIVIRSAVEKGYKPDCVLDSDVRPLLNPTFYKTIMNLILRYLLNPDRSICSVVFQGLRLFLVGLKDGMDGVVLGITSRKALEAVMGKLQDCDETDPEYGIMVTKMFRV